MKPNSVFFALLLTLAFFIQSAGAQADAQAGKLHCPYCSVLNPTESKFCHACGSRLPEPVVTQVRPMVASSLDEATHQPSTSLTSKALSPAEKQYEIALTLVGQGRFAEAAGYFHRIAKEYPEFDYAKQSAQMAIACEKLLQEQKLAALKTNKREPSNAAAFGGAFIGSLAGTLGTILVLLVLASGS